MTDGKRDRPDVLTGVTQRITTGYGKMYVNVNVDGDGKPFEVFVNIGDSGGFTKSFSEGLAKTVSNALRGGIDPEVVAEDLMMIRSPKVEVDNGDYVYSIPDGIGIALMRVVECDDPVEAEINGELSKPVRGDAINGSGPEPPSGEKEWSYEPGEGGNAP